MENVLHRRKKRFFPAGKTKSFQSLPVFLLVFFCIFSTVLFAQATIDGKVSSGDTAIAGASVQVKGTNIVTQTNANGNFSIKAPSNATLVVSFIGFSTEEVKVENRPFI